MRPGCGSAPCAHAVCMYSACNLHVVNVCTHAHAHAHAHVRCAILRREGRGALMRALLDAGVAVRQGHSRPRATLLDHLDQHACHVQGQAVARQARWRRAGGAGGAETPRVASPPFFPPGDEPCAASQPSPLRLPSARQSPHITRTRTSLIWRRGQTLSLMGG